ncbi:TPA: hypothetical protein ACOELP_002648 [Enterobacter hormaechei]
MMELTKERLKEIAQCNVAFGKLATLNEVVIMAEALLAGLEQEPYGYVHKEVYESEGSCGLSSDHEAHRDSRTHIPLYAAPQLTQPALDLREVFEAWAISKCWDVRRGETGAYISMCTHDAWTVVSACRDAIIAAKGDCR